MSFSYKPLWKLLIEKDMNRTAMREELGFSPATIAKMGKDEYVSMEILDKLCTHFSVQPNDIIEWKGDQ
jgi:putative transcriptional regulator